MAKLYFFTLLMLIFIGVEADSFENAPLQDSNEVRHLNRLAFSNCQDNPKQTIAYSHQALELATKINYVNGIAEANRMLGVGNAAVNNQGVAIQYYLTALNWYQKGNNLAGEMRVYNNIGNQYEEVDYDKALEYFTKALTIADKLHQKPQLAILYLNLGNVYYRQKKFTNALNYYKNSEQTFKLLNDTVDVVYCLHNEGVVYFNIHEYDNAKRLLVYANNQAKSHDLNKCVASIDITLTSLYTAENDFPNALKTLNEGKYYANLIQSDKLKYDYLVTSYEFEYKRKNYKQAFDYLRTIYKQDSIFFKSNTSLKLNLLQDQFRQQDLQRRTAFELQRQSYNRYKFIAATIVAGLLLIVILLLVGNVKRKAETNKRLTELNAEVNYQKDNLDKINHHLEEIIDERTKDLQDKNAKLSEYSSYLSHQIRGPIATLKGLINLEKENLLNQRECIAMMDKCVSDIDDKIISISDMLHDEETLAVKSR